MFSLQDQHQLPIKMGVVRYLNMLPYFWNNDRIFNLYDSPSTQNEDLRNHKLTACCTSLVAGLKQESSLKLLGDGFGVASQQQVQSVFIECPTFSQLQKDFWSEFEDRNKNFGIHKKPQYSRKQTVKIYSNGASEHSVWLIQKLLEWQGFQVDFQIKAFYELKKNIFEKEKDDSLSAYIMIGDYALFRNMMFPFTDRKETDFIRLDIGKLWFDFASLPCVFAGWFSQTEHQVHEHHLATLIEHQIIAWHSLSTKNQTNAISLHLSKRFPQISFSDNLLEDCLSYFGGLQLKFEPAHMETINIYRKLLKY